MRRWSVLVLRRAKLIDEFEDGRHGASMFHLRHHDQVPGVQKAFASEVQTLVGLIEEYGNPFLDDIKELTSLDTHEVSVNSVVKNIYEMEKIVQNSYESFVKERLVDGIKSILDPVSKNKLMRTLTARSVSKEKLKIKSLKMHRELFARLFISCQTRQGDLDKFF